MTNVFLLAYSSCMLYLVSYCFQAHISFHIPVIMMLVIIIVYLERALILQLNVTVDFGPYVLKFAVAYSTK